MGKKSAKSDPCERAPQAGSPIYCIVEPAQIHFLTCLLEAYEGLAVGTTLDPQLGLLKLSVAPGCERDLLAVLESERETLQLQAVSPDPLVEPPEQPPDAGKPKHRAPSFAP